MYDKNIEEKYYSICENRGYFEIDGNKAIQKKNKTFCIMMPPPNVTGILHIGHALTFTLQDIMVRYKRMDGYKTLYQPGLDHAGIATQNVVEKQLLSQGIKKENLSRSEFIDKVWQWKEKSGGQILNQMRSLGITPAWSRLRFTMDSGLVNAVKKAFVNLYNKGLIERGNYMINWCTHDGALSDIEVEYKENYGKLYHIRYFFKDSKDYLVVATTRPETFFGDTAVMVNPNDERYKKFIGKELVLPLSNKIIKIIGDNHVDMEFGTGVVKVTPAHDMNDYEVGLRHNLEFLSIFDEKGILNEHCLEFQGLERLQARDKIVASLQEKNFIEDIQEHKNQMGYCYRCKNIVEPYISKQWFVKKDIAKESIEKVALKESKFYPAHWINSFNAWMKELRPWCISRQLWWGHQIPVYYCACGNEFASEDSLSICPKCGSKDFKQDEDVLDTWFSSGLWAMSTLGWGNGDWGKDKLWNENDLKEFYPNSLLITGFDILFFWVARMMFQSTNLLHKLPFKHIYLHALVKDEQGRKMSKSLGNVIDPNESIKEYSADILRFTLALIAIQGRDIKLSNDKLLQVRNFTNKLYNAANYLLLNENKFEDLENIELKSSLAKFINAKFQDCVKEVRENLDNYRFNDAANCLYKFFWDDFCDWGIELSKAEKSSVKELGSIFKSALKLLHPFMPFLSEFLYHRLSATSLENSDSIMISSYPVVNKQDEKIKNLFELLIESIVSIRRTKTLLELKSIEKAYIKLNNMGLKEELKNLEIFIKTLAKCQNIEFTDKIIENAVRDVSENLELFISLENVDLSAIIARFNNQKAKLEKEINKLNNMLGNEKFIANAPKEVVATNKEALKSLNEQLAKIEEELDKFKVKN
ncbi:MULTISPECIES: valine--tRNA ligase [unclassified Campylobacter]|uniref:valine--tRNA ligase n=1 Tax=unclassified Campylobacter TaxID=2593542 RepID=UPI0012380958|nr:MULTISPECIES: valine--tRNA ligase [unclassified Campylobacter]KAA6226355.1 valine--tRNA ligase [Campylobacter sp. LR286c]KAA6226607.1 valine--tRNA ligase [Campylobacter sp. LR185c]KAA6226847.1 valine--tRNA ligase [Campylobacter sp. LR196d]KAA6230284.1 valine--tRNA ligase [Campylobacter sp. LR291e]KAA8603589.1 valine--tRNA ligase [Campylobacter sp. LR185c]